MAFENQAPLTPTSIGRIVHVLSDMDGTNGNQSMRYHLAILDQNGDVMRQRRGDEAPHLVAGQISALRSFMAARRAALPTNLNFPAGHTVGRIVWQFTDLDGTNPTRSLLARVVRNDAGGQFQEVYVVDDQDFMTGAQVSNAVSFLDTQRGKAVAQIL